MTVVGLTGTRGVGKSSVADIMVAEHGFTKIHSFGPGKAMTMAYFMHLGMDQETAFRSTYGDLKDTKHPLIPGDGLPRTFMEELGKFMGTQLGPEYTLGAEISRAKRVDPDAKLVIESVVYEAPLLKTLGGYLMRIIRSKAEGVIEGKHTDEAVDSIRADGYLFNESDSKEALSVQVQGMLTEMGVM